MTDPFTVPDLAVVWGACPDDYGEIAALTNKLKEHWKKYWSELAIDPPPPGDLALWRGEVMEIVLSDLAGLNTQLQFQADQLSTHLRENPDHVLLTLLPKELS